MWLCHKSKLVHKKNCATVLLILCISGVIFILLGCCATIPKAPIETSLMWICDDPKIVLNYQHNTDGAVQQCWIVYNGEQVEVVTDYRANLFWVELPGPRSDEGTLFQGKWKYKKDKLIFTIEEDNFFGGDYKTLVFSKGE